MFLNLFQAWSMIKNVGWSLKSFQILNVLTMKRLLFPVSLGISALIVLIVWFVDTSFFYRNDEFCWIRPQSAILACLIPVLLIFLNTLICFGIFCVRKFPHRFARFGVKPPIVEPTKLEIAQRRTNFKIFLAVLFSQFLLGLPWVHSNIKLLFILCLDYPIPRSVFIRPDGLALFIRDIQRSQRTHNVLYFHVRACPSLV